MFHVKHQIEYLSFTKENHKKVDVLFSKYDEVLNLYIDRVLWWNRKINLVSRDVSRETLEQHVKHCLALSGHPVFSEAGRIIDAGTGGGLPGVPLALCYPEKKFVLNDIVQKKIMALKQIGKEVGELHNVEYSAEAIENAFSKGAFNLLVSKHAFKINDLVKMVDLEKTPMLLLKGKELEEELEGVEKKLKITVFDLYSESRNAFYEGKAIIEIHTVNEK